MAKAHKIDKMAVGALIASSSDCHDDAVDKQVIESAKMTVAI